MSQGWVRATQRSLKWTPKTSIPKVKASKISKNGQEFLEWKCLVRRPFFSEFLIPWCLDFPGKNPAKIESFFCLKKGWWFPKAVCQQIKRSICRNVVQHWKNLVGNFYASQPPIADLLGRPVSQNDCKGLRPWRLVTTAKQLGNFPSPH